MAKLYCFQKDGNGNLDWVPITASGNGKDDNDPTSSSYIAAVKTFILPTKPVYDDQIKKMKVSFENEDFIYNKFRDTLLVFRNGDLLTQNLHYNIINDCAIVPVDDVRWNIDMEFVLVFFINARIGENTDNLIDLLKPDSITNDLLNTNIKIGSLKQVNKNISARESIIDIINELYVSITDLQTNKDIIGDSSKLSENIVTTILLLDKELKNLKKIHGDDNYTISQTINNLNKRLLCGTSKFSGYNTSGTIIQHNAGTTNYSVSITPLGDIDGSIGEYSVEKTNNKIIVKNTGDSTACFDWMIITK